MANFEKTIPFILHCEEGILVEKLSLPPQQIFELEKKKGVHYDPNDSGGYTICGVTLNTYRDYRRKHGHPTTTLNDLRNIPYREWKDILKTMFWDKWKADEIKSEMIAIALVDWVWLSGKYGITKPQALLGVKADGIVGPKTLAAVNNYPNQQDLFNKIQSARMAYHYSLCYRGPNKSLPTNKARYFRGWNRRVAMITWNGFNYKAKYEG